MTANITVLDIESYFDSSFSLRRGKLTIPEYVSDARYHEHGLAIRWPDGRCEFIADVADAIRQLRLQFGTELERTTIACHNAAFDLYALNHRHGVRPGQFIDTMLLAYHVHGRRDRAEGEHASLEALAQRYGLEPKRNLDFMCGVRNPDGRQWLELTEYARHDAELTYQLALRLLPHVSRPKVELAIMQHTIRLFSERGIQVDRDAIEGLATEVRRQTEESLRAASIEASEVSKNDTFAQHFGAVLAKTGAKSHSSRARIVSSPPRRKGTLRCWPLSTMMIPPSPH